MTEIEIMQMTRENKKLRRDLQKLSDHVLVFLHHLDTVVMVGPSTPDRGRKIARMSNELDKTNDLIRYCSLRVNYLKDDKAKASKRIIMKWKKKNGTL